MSFLLSYIIDYEFNLVLKRSEDDEDDCDGPEVAGLFK